ncbi:cupin domain-containing protein [Pseudothermotoga sp.]|nr:cupin domain-containing protein [Pseudothermotoga sp.]MCX7813415.1 cupin domain-containing protein [Pseudothermotoga sp.]MDW8139597.1 cupin domain-containing protein [Pseudothermotoga sp.]
MVLKSEQMRREIISNMRGGKGEVELLHLLERNMLANRARLFAKLTLKPGVSIGPHKHENEFEVFFVLNGRGIFYDNGQAVDVKPGDVCFTMSGDTHSIENPYNEDLQLLAIIVLL